MFARDEDVDAMIVDGRHEKDEGGVDGMVASSSPPMEVSLVTCGVWVPVATALMEIFSPGMANVLQVNYSALDTFFSELATTLLSESPSSSLLSVERTTMDRSSVPRGDYSRLYYKPVLHTRSIQRAQS